MFRPTYPGEHVTRSTIDAGGGRSTGDRTTPRRGRDPFVDTLRAGAIILIVVQHWLMPVIGTADGADLLTGNALAVPGAWIITWISQVMPLVFFAGGAAAVYGGAAALRRGRPEHVRAWIADRLVRLARPVLPLAAIWVPLPHLLVAAGVPAQAVDVGARLVGALLWFLALYTVIVAATPVLLRWSDRRPVGAVSTLAAGAVLVDLARFATGFDALGYVNLALVWSAVYLAGAAYADGRWDRVEPRTWWWVAGAGFGITAIAVAAGPYAPSMIGMPGAPLSNMNPPTAVLLSLAAGQLGVALALRHRIVAWAAQPEVARAVKTLSTRLMTVYVWHTPALIMVAGVAVLGFGWSTPDPFGDQWRSQMPIWLAALTVVLAGLIRLFGHAEDAGRSRSRRPGRVSPSAPVLTTGVVVVAVVLVGSGLLTLTVAGFAPAPGGIGAPGWPLVGALAVAVGTALLRFRRMTGSNDAPARERLIP